MGSTLSRVDNNNPRHDDISSAGAVAAAGAGEAVTSSTKPTAATATGSAREGRLGALPLSRRSVDHGPDRGGAETKG